MGDGGLSCRDRTRQRRQAEESRGRGGPECTALSFTLEARGFGACEPPALSVLKRILAAAHGGPRA